MVGVVRVSTGREPQVAGKPGPALLQEAARRSGARNPLMVGDRLDTDIEGGRAAGMATLLVLTGISDAAELLAARAQLRPDYVAADLDGLTTRPEDLAFGSRPGWDVRVPEPGSLVLAGTGADPVDALRALCAAHWAAGGGPAHVTADGDDAAAALRRLGLDAPGSATVASVGKHDQTAGADR
jgi:hypothetical protein